ncbi:MAG: wax ester/triacylglycerol synthase family O-acyltransferase [Acidimicrobiales bacterium]|jgi:WS/DGAT/MGAT family acyltransferase|nr:wax ester/triacylglycerol synthase family O-acyltransferase [Acidimicrobiales bacterium]
MPDDDRYLSANDTLMWVMERDRRLRGTATTVMVLDGPVDHGRLAERMERVSRLFPRMRQRIVETPAGIAPPRWVVDDQFDLAYHLRRAAVPAPGDLRSVLDLAQSFAMTAFDKERSLWEYTLLEGLEGGRSVLVQKVHHAMSDGVGGMELAREFFDSEPATDSGFLPPTPEPEPLGTADLVREGVTHRVGELRRRALHLPLAAASAAAGAVRDPAGSAAAASQSLQDTLESVRPVTTPPSPALAGRGMNRWFGCFDVPFGGLRGAARDAGATVNDVFLAALAGGLGRYHEQLGFPVQPLRIAIPVSTRREGDARAGNRLSLGRFELPADDPDPRRRIATLHEVVTRVREQVVNPMTDTVIGLMSQLPAPVLGRAFGGMLFNVDVMASNVPGFRALPELCGRRSLAWYAFGPTEGTAVNVTMMSHGEHFCVGMACDTTAVEEPAVLVDCLREGFGEVLALAPR